MTTQKKIDFLIVGAQKSGTSALHVYLRKHPEIFGLDQKEVIFFNYLALAKSPIIWFNYEI